MDAVSAAMAPGGRLVTFTYVHSQVLPASLRFRKILQRYFGVVRRTKIQWANVPPAFVYVFWIDETGAAVPLYPWVPLRWGTRPAAEASLAVTALAETSTMCAEPSART